MYKKQKPDKTSIAFNESYQGESIEQKINRIINNKEPIKDGAPLIYTERKDGIQPQYDIRTDRWEVAVDAMDTVQKAHTAKRENRIGQEAMKGMNEEQKAEYVKKNPNVQYTPKPKEGNSGAESTQATETK